MIAFSLIITFLYFSIIIVGINYYEKREQKNDEQLREIITSLSKDNDILQKQLEAVKRENKALNNRFNIEYEYKAYRNERFKGEHNES